MTLAVSGISFPAFAPGILFMQIFSVWLGWLPSMGRFFNIFYKACITLYNYKSANSAFSLDSLLLELFHIQLFLFHLQ